MNNSVKFLLSNSFQNTSDYILPEMVIVNTLDSKEICNNGTSWLVMELGSSQILLLVKTVNVQDQVQILKNRNYVSYYMNNVIMQV